MHVHIDKKNITITMYLVYTSIQIYIMIALLLIAKSAELMAVQ